MKVIADVGPGAASYYRHRAVEEIMSGNLQMAVSILALAQYYDI